MHELSIALSIVDIASEEARRHGAARIGAVHLKLGALSGVVADALRFSYDLACEGSSLQGSRLVVEDVPVVTYCETCQRNRPVASIQWMRCAACGEPAETIVSGRELEVTAMEIN